MCQSAHLSNLQRVNTVFISRTSVLASTGIGPTVYHRFAETIEKQHYYSGTLIGSLINITARRGLFDSTLVVF